MPAAVLIKRLEKIPAKLSCRSGNSGFNIPSWASVTSKTRIFMLNLTNNRFLPLAMLSFGICIGLASCGFSGKNTSTRVSDDGRETQTVQVEHTPQGIVTTTTTRIIEPHSNQSGTGILFEHNGDDTDFSAKENRAEPEDLTPNYAHIRAPGVRIDANDSNGSLYIKVPGVNITKEGSGIRIKVPYARINAED